MSQMEPSDPGELANGIFSAEELAIYATAGYGQTATPGVCPALLIVDVTYAFTG
jgi:hypothetical protein